MKIRWLGNSCIEIQGNTNILIDPNYLTEPESDIKIVLVTHEHDDHCDPDKLEALGDFQLYAPKSVFDNFDLEGNTVKSGDKINNNIDVIECDCYGSEESVCYYYEGIYHTADASTYQDPEDVDILFTACFDNLYDEYLDSIQQINPKLVIPYHYDPNNEDESQEAKGLRNLLRKKNQNVNIMELGEQIFI